MQGNIKKLLFIFIISVAVVFKIFTELYLWNYCAPRGGFVVIGSSEEIEKMSQCSDSFICKLWGIKNSTLPSAETGQAPIQIKNFDCIRRF